MSAALQLRYEVFCVEQGVPEREELDGRDREGIHLVAVSDGELVGTCRLLMVGATAQLSRLAVRTSARRRGIATALLEPAEAETLAAGGRRIVLHAQTYARKSVREQPATDRAGGSSSRRGSSTSRWRKQLD